MESKMNRLQLISFSPKQFFFKVAGFSALQENNIDEYVAARAQAIMRNFRQNTTSGKNTIEQDQHAGAQVGVQGKDKRKNGGNGP